MMHLDILIEEVSAEPVVRRIAEATIDPRRHTFAIRVFDGKTDLLGSLEERLRGYRNWGIDVRVMVLVDRDDDDCRELKARLEAAARSAGLRTRTASNGQPFSVCNRIACEELEAWFLGDESALRAEFMRLRPFANKERFRDPDAIPGGTWEALERLLQGAGHYPGGLRKIDLARRLAPRLDLATNRSASFRCFVTGLVELMAA